jgi:adenosine deaminase
VRIIDDITLGPDGKPRLGDLAAYIRDQRIPLEMCPSSNVHTGAASSVAEHPIGLLRRLRFRVTVNSDNQLMSRTTLSREFALLCEAFDYTLDDVRWFTINAAKSAFYPFDARLRLIEDVIKPGFAALGAPG